MVAAGRTPGGPPDHMLGGAENMSEAGLVLRTIWILRAVAAHPAGVGLSEVAREVGIPKATCYRVLSVLERERWLTMDRDTRRYRVSLGLLSVVGGFLERDGAYDRMRGVLRDLAEQVQETAGLDVLLPPHVMVVAQVPGPRLIGQTAKPVPRTLPVWSTSTGKLLIAHADLDEVRRDFAEDFATNGPGRGSSEGSLDDFLGVLAQVRERGYAVAYNELEKGAAAIAAPVVVRGDVAYALWIGGPTYRITPDRLEALARDVCAAADELGRFLTVTDLVLPAPQL
jgi:IclR family acetate operon transcriptional repressor